jgi:Replication protein/Transposase zinc-binding domain
MAVVLEMQERAAPSRPSSLGTRRRKPAPRVSAVPKAGASRSGGARASSLDTSKQLATTMREWCESVATEADDYRRTLRFHAQLVTTFHKIWQHWASKATAQEDLDWQKSYSDARREWTQAFQNLDSDGDLNEVKALWKLKKAWLRKNRPTGANLEALKWETQWSRLRRCQREWVGYRAECCKGATKPMAVPVGCNHRLCPLCSWHRTKLAQKRVRTMYDRLTHPVLITLTVPNTIDIRKKHFEHMRKRVRQFVKQHPRWFKGGVYSLETTFNRKEKTWHLHVHILADADVPLPTVEQKQNLFGKVEFCFTKLKWELEFDWLRLWAPKLWGRSMPHGENMRKSRMKYEGDRFIFETWVRSSRANVTHYYNRHLRQSVRIPGLSDSEFNARTEWNRKNRRIVDIRPVVDRDGAAKEVMKYITKSAAFCDLTEAVEPFCNAVRGARLVQTFGSWYGISLEGTPDPEQPKDWGKMKCACGVNHWLHMGVFNSSDVEMDEEGRWWLKTPLDHRSRGTVPRPTIRALEARIEEETSYGGTGGPTGCEEGAFERR